MPPRGRPRKNSTDVNALEEEMQRLRDRQSEIRQQLRRLRNSEGEVRKLEEKLEKQFAAAKWTVGEIRQLNPTWDEQRFYENVQAKKPTPRGRRPRAASNGSES